MRCLSTTTRGWPALAVKVRFGVALAFGWALVATAQSPSQMETLPTFAVPLPLSGHAGVPGGVSVSEGTASATAPGSVDGIQSTVTVQPPYSGSVPSAPRLAGPMRLTLEQALALGMRYNLGSIKSSAAVMQARGQRLVVRSQLLPNLNTAGSEVFEQINLRTQGVETNQFPTAAEFNYFDLRAAKLKQTVFDLVSTNNLRAASESLKSTAKAVKNTRDLIVLAVGGSYLRLTATMARIDSAQAEVNTAQAVYKQAEDRFFAGLAPRIDVSRSQVQLQTEQQRLRSLQGDFELQKIAFARVIGLAPGQAYNIEGTFPFSPFTSFSMEDALKQALAQRADLQAADSAVKAAISSVHAARAEHLPNLKVNADVGVAGLRPTADVSAVYSVSGTLTIPIFEGGRIAGDVEQAAAALKQREAERDDIRGQIDEDVRQAFIQLNTAADQVKVADSNRELSQQTLTQARDRFAAGVADTVEVVQAEQAVVQADDDSITAVYEHNLAKISLARAIGNTEQMLPQFLRQP